MKCKYQFLTIIVILSFSLTSFAQDPIILEHGGAIQSVVASPTHNAVFVSASDDNTIKLWDLHNKILTTFTGHLDKVNDVDISPNGELLASGSDDQTFKLWSIPQQQHIATLEHIPFADASPSLVPSVAFSPDGEFLATAGYQSVILWDVDDQTETGKLEHDDWVYAVVFSANGQFLAVVDGKQIKIWDVQKQQIIVELEGNEHWIGNIAFSPDSSILANAGEDGIITLRSTSNWSVIGRISTFGSVHDLDFSPDGKTLASAGHEVGLWSVEYGEKIASITDYNDWVQEVAFSSEGTILASSESNDGTLRIQNIETLLDVERIRDTVRLIYFVPSDRTPQSDIDTKIETLVKATQTFFADMMEEHGYGRKTFTYETDAESNAVIHHITGQFTDAYYNNNDKWKIWDEIRAAGHDPTQNIYIAVMEFSEILDGLHCSTGGNWDRGGVVNLIASDECFSGDDTGALYGVALVAHEIGHAFGLQHDYRNHPDRAKGIGEDVDLMISSPCAAGWLDAHRYFNSGTTYFNEPTTIEMWPPRATDSEEIRLRFTITDLDGLHQARLLSTILQVDYFAGRDYLEEQNYLDESLLDCQSLSDGSTTAEFITTQLTTDNDTVVLRVIDVKGNFTEARFSFDITALPQHLEDINGDGIVNIQDLVLVASNFGKQGIHLADVNEDGVVNIIDLVLVAGAFGKGAAAPSMRHHDPEAALTQANIQQWLDEARQVNLTDPNFQRGILMLEQFLIALTPKETTLLPNYPNPFNPETWVPYQLAEPAEVSIAIYTVSGKLVRTLDLGHQAAGIYESRNYAAYWNGKNQLGETVASGVYFYTLTAGDFAATRKMLIRK